MLDHAVVKGCGRDEFKNVALRSLMRLPCGCQAKKHLGPKLIAAAAASGIDIKYIDSEKPLTDQEPFDVLIHKIRTPGRDMTNLIASLCCLMRYTHAMCSCAHMPFYFEGMSDLSFGKKLPRNGLEVLS